MISKLGNFTDPLIDAQIGEIVSNQFSNYKEVTVTFTAANTTTKVDVGFLADRFIIIDQTADMRIWRMSSDSRYMYLQASRAGSVTLKVWKSDQLSTANAVGTAGTGGGGAPLEATYVVLSAHADLSQERVLTGTTNQISITDNGAGSSVVLSTPQDIHTGASPTFAGVTLPNTVSSITGVIRKGTDRFIHNFQPSGVSGSNVFIGRFAGNFTMAGAGETFHASYNIGIGYNALCTLTSGYCNTAIGFGALATVDTGAFNTAVGRQALQQNTGGNNTSVGSNSLGVNTTGADNTGIGMNSLRDNTTGAANTAVGAYSLISHVSGNDNVAVGRSSLVNSISAGGNTACGRSSLRNATGSFNVGIGYEAGGGYSNNAPWAYRRNILIGYRAGFELQTGGDNNIFIGHQTGDNVMTGANNIIIGYNLDAPLATSSDYLNIGNIIEGNLSTGSVGIGTTSPTALLKLKGTLSSALTGTVAVINLSTAVVGTGTLFTTELAVGDSIKIGAEVFTVSVITDNLNLTLDSAYQGATTSGLTAYRDPTLFAVDNGDAVNKLTITRGGNVGIGTVDQFGGGGKVIGLSNASTVPSANPTGGGVLYCEAGALKYRGSSGTITTLGVA